ncbi:MAG: GGDEF domain-containing protein [Pseudomonadota bacterium]
MDRIKRRMREELDLAIVTIFGTIAAIAVLGFAAYRFASGSLAGGLLDCGISIGLGAVVIYAWRTTDVARAGAVFVGFAAFACVASSLLFGGTATYWAFVVLSVSFVVTRSGTAIVCCLAVIVAIGGQADLFANVAERAIFFVTAGLVSLFCWIFNTRYTIQHKQLERMALRDPLTQAGNRRAMQRALVAAIMRRRKRGEPAVVAAMDLDHFKAVNDRYGHEVGDRVLIEVAAIVRDRLRREDGFFRMGGEEFVVLLPATTLTRGRQAVLDLHRLVGEGMESADMPVTISVGVAALDAEDDWSAWLRRADAALYRAKAAGRDQVVFDEQEDPGMDVEDRRQPDDASG